MYSERERWCDGDGNAGVGTEGGVAVVSGVGIWVVYVFQVLCLLPTPC